MTRRTRAPNGSADRPSIAVLLLVLLITLPAQQQLSARQLVSRAGHSRHRVQQLTDKLRSRLAIPQRVIVTVVDRDPLAASVRPAKGRQGGFVLSLDRGFLASLTKDELEAVVAHELGHVWISTHHPYLQTEQLANRVAMRLVARESLEQLYGKLWGAGSVTGSLASFLGLPAAAGQAIAPAAQAPLPR